MPETVSAPTRADVVVASIMVLAAITLYVVLDAVLRVLIRRAQQNRAVRRYRREAEAARWARTGLL